MSDSNQNATAETQVSETTPQNPTEIPKLKVDPLVLFKQIEEMRKEGVAEEVIREAFVQFMEQYQGNVRKVPRTVRRTVDSVPMPTQAEINKMYEDRYKGITDEDNNPQVALVLEALETSKSQRELAKKYKVPLKTRVARYLVRHLISTCIYLCRILGVK